MPDNKFFDLFVSSPCILGEGAVIERLRRNTNLALDPHLVNAAFIYSEESRSALESICRQYLEIGREYDLPLLVSTPTWRANRERIAMAGFEDFDVNGDNAKFLNDLRAGYDSYAEKVIICGLMSCRGNAYAPVEALDVAEAQAFHSWQAEKLAKSEVDVILASTLPAISEATGLALALAATGKPYLISFVVRPEGTLLDGTPLHLAINAVDTSVKQKPFAYMINCTHASFARAALLQPTNSSPLVRQRIVGLLANTAALSPEKLDDSVSLVEEEPADFANTVAALHRDLGLKILGGCCGTDDQHIRALAAQLANNCR
ncbi:MAG: homocysteine S-methyltransferase family protein [Deltaproteobacteria bacterium]|nr:homocysteine S-methyltransferase family protein [Deltaproteobacteria bacterium]